MWGTGTAAASSDFMSLWPPYAAEGDLSAQAWVAPRGWTELNQESRRFHVSASWKVQIPMNKWKGLALSLFCTRTM